MQPTVEMIHTTRQLYNIKNNKQHKLYYCHCHTHLKHAHMHTDIHSNNTNTNNTNNTNNNNIYISLFFTKNMVVSDRLEETNKQTTKQIHRQINK